MAWKAAEVNDAADEFLQIISQQEWLNENCELQRLKACIAESCQPMSARILGRRMGTANLAVEICGLSVIIVIGVIRVIVYSGESA